MDMKPPISRAKMILITKAAIKAIKVRVKIFNLKNFFGNFENIVKHENSTC